jgi:hypothetical protein
MVQRIRERRRRLGKGRWGRGKSPNLETRSGRLDLQAQLNTENKLIKFDKTGLSVYDKTQPQSFARQGAALPDVSGITNSLTAFYYANKKLVQVVSAIIAGWYMYTKTDILTKKKSKIRRKRKKATPKKVATVRRTATGRTGNPVMPIKYRTGCKGKKGTELGKCLQYWRKYRKGEIKLK